MFEQVTPQYIRFIKQYLCQRLFTKYVNIGFTTDIPDEDTVYNELVCPEIWHDIFNEEHMTLNYYVQLLSNYTEEQQAISNKTLPVYRTETFQEYIDRRVNINTIGTHDYQQFTKNMKDETFHRNMIQKYEAEQFLRKVKNHLIYIIRLYIIKSNNPDIYMTEDEAKEVDTCLDMTPFFKYMRSNNWVDHTQCYSESENNKVEADAMTKIYESIYS
jgi:hypothetical protein